MSGYLYKGIELQYVVNFSYDKTPASQSGPRAITYIDAPFNGNYNDNYTMNGIKNQIIPNKTNYSQVKVNGLTNAYKYNNVPVFSDTEAYSVEFNVNSSRTINAPIGCNKIWFYAFSGGGGGGGAGGVWDGSDGRRGGKGGNGKYVYGTLTTGNYINLKGAFSITFTLSGYGTGGLSGVSKAPSTSEGINFSTSGSTGTTINFAFGTVAGTINGGNGGSAGENANNGNSSGGYVGSAPAGIDGTYIANVNSPDAVISSTDLSSASNTQIFNWSSTNASDNSPGYGGLDRYNIQYTNAGNVYSIGNTNTTIDGRRAYSGGPGYAQVFFFYD